MRACTLHILFGQEAKSSLFLGPLSITLQYQEFSDSSLVLSNHLVLQIHYRFKLIRQDATYIVSFNTIQALFINVKCWEFYSVGTNHCIHETLLHGLPRIPMNVTTIN